MLARSGGRVEVGDKPLAMRAEYELDSPLVMVLRQGQMVTVLEERPMTDEGKVRAQRRLEPLTTRFAACLLILCSSPWLDRCARA